MEALYKRRLLVLAGHLRKVPARRFRMGAYMESDRVGFGKLGRWAHNCGSYGCALGHAAAIPAFRKAGYQLTRHFPFFKGEVGQQATSRFFGLSFMDTLRLFGSPGINMHRHQTPACVASNIERFVREAERANV